VTRSEIARLLAVIAAFDRRTVGDADVLAWHDVLGDLDFTDADTAAKAHYRDSREFLMPADVRHRVMRLREQRLSTGGDSAVVPDADPDDVPAWLEALRAGRMRRASPPQHVAARRRDVPALTAHTFRQVPRDPA
jgi:hypothetical protein